MTTHRHPRSNVQCHELHPGKIKLGETKINDRKFNEMQLKFIRLNAICN